MSSQPVLETLLPNFQPEILNKLIETTITPIAISTNTFTKLIETSIPSIDLPTGTPTELIDS